MARKPKRAAIGDRPRDWAEQLRFDMAFAQKTLLETGEVGPIFVIHGSAETVVVGCQWETDEDKSRGAMLARMICIAHDAQAMSLITEAWTRSYQRYAGETAAEFDARAHIVMPADAEDRCEVVMCTLTWRDEANERHTLTDMREIERRANGKPSGLKPLGDDTSYDQMSGRMVEILPERPATPAEREAAKTLLAMAGKSSG